jgi:hypothetical protein
MLMSLSRIACSSTGNEQGSSAQASNEEAEESAASDNPKAQNTQQHSKSNAPSQQNLSIGDAATFAYGSSVTLYSYTSPVQSDNPLQQPQAGNQFAVIDVEGSAGNTEVTNESGEAGICVQPVLLHPRDARWHTVTAHDIRGRACS